MAPRSTASGTQQPAVGKTVPTVRRPATQKAAKTSATVAALTAQIRLANPTPEKHLNVRLAPVAGGPIEGRYRLDYFVTVPALVRIAEPALFPRAQESFGSKRTEALQRATEVSWFAAPSDERPPILLCDFTDLFLHAMEVEAKPDRRTSGNHRKDPTLQQMRNSVRILNSTKRRNTIKQLKDVRLSDVTESDITDYVQVLAKTYSLKSQPQLISKVRMMFAWAHDNGFVAVDHPSPVTKNIAAVAPKIRRHTPPPSCRVLNAAQAAMVLKITHDTVTTWARAGRLRAVKVHGKYQIFLPESQVAPWVKATIPPYVQQCLYDRSQISLSELTHAFTVALDEETEQVQLVLWLQAHLGLRAEEWAGLADSDWFDYAQGGIYADPSQPWLGDGRAPVGALRIDRQWSPAVRDYTDTKNGNSRILYVGPLARQRILRLIEIGATLQAACLQRGGSFWQGEHGIPLFCDEVGRPGNVEELNDALARVLLRAGFPDKRSAAIGHVHGLRHLAGSLFFVASGRSVTLTAKFLGITEPVAQRTYIHIPQDDLVAATLDAEEMVDTAPTHLVLAARGDLQTIQSHVETAWKVAQASDTFAVAAEQRAAMARVQRVEELFLGRPPQLVRARLLAAQQDLERAAGYAQRNQAGDADTEVAPLPVVLRLVAS
jgi:hypothetical protein